MIWSAEEAICNHSLSWRLGSILPKYLPPGPVTDYGCGTGYYTRVLREAGYEVTGIEGTEEINEISFIQDILVRDLTKAIVLTKSTTLCLEVAEHIERQYEGVFLKNITENCSGKIILSWAVLHQGGLGHVNEVNNIEVVNKLNNLGFSLNFKETLEIRREMSGDPCWWFENTLFIFEKA